MRKKYLAKNNMTFVATWISRLILILLRKVNISTDIIRKNLFYQFIVHDSVVKFTTIQTTLHTHTSNLWLATRHPAEQRKEAMGR